MDDSVIMCDEATEKTIPTNFNERKATCKMQNFFILLALLLSLRLEGQDTLKYYCVCRSRAEKFYILSNDHGRTHKCDFFVFDWKLSFWANLVKKSKFSV